MPDGRRYGKYLVFITAGGVFMYVYIYVCSSHFMYFVMILTSFCILGTLFRKTNMVAEGAQSVTVHSSFLFSDVGLTTLFLPQVT